MRAGDEVVVIPILLNRVRGPVGRRLDDGVVVDGVNARVLLRGGDTVSTGGRAGVTRLGCLHQRGDMAVDNSLDGARLSRRSSSRPQGQDDPHQVETHLEGVTAHF